MEQEEVFGEEGGDLTRLEPQIVAHFKLGGAGWQKRMEAALLKVVGK